MNDKYIGASVFRYTYRPLGHSKCDGGFTVTVFENCMLSFCDYDRHGFPMHECWFDISKDVLLALHRLIDDNKTILMQRMPLMIAKSDPLFGCVFGFDQYRPIYIIGLYDLAKQARENTPGLLAQRVVMIFDSVSNLLLSCGLYLSIENFVWFQHATMINETYFYPHSVDK